MNSSLSRLTGFLLLLVWAVACRSNAPQPEKGAAGSAAPAAVEEIVRVAIGTQDTTINCATGGPLVRELHLLEKHLPRTGKYQHVKYEIKWENQPTGAQLNSKYLANQLDIVQMADFPSVLGATALKAAGAHGVVKMGTAIQVVIGTDADPIAAEIEDMM